jgi:hypothetical protein
VPIPNEVVLGLPGEGTLTLRILLVKDDREIEEWALDENLPPRDVAVKILEHQFVAASRPLDLTHASDPELGDLLRGWLRRSIPDLDTRPHSNDLSSLAVQLREHYRQRRQELLKSISGLIGADAIANIANQQANLSRLIEPWIDQQAHISRVIQPLLAHQAEISRILQSTTLSASVASGALQIQRLFPSAEQLRFILDAFRPFQGFTVQLPQALALPTFPDLSLFAKSFTDGLLGTSQELLIRFHTREQAGEALAIHSLRFVNGILPYALAVRLTTLKDPKDVRAVMGKLGQWIRSEKFRRDFMDALERHPRSRRRMPIARDALDAHVARKYSLSIPALIAQAEGVLTDYLVEAQLVRTWRGKVYALISGTRDFKRRSQPVNATSSDIFSKGVR